MSVLLSSKEIGLTPRTIILTSFIFVLIALALGVAVGDNLSAEKISTFTEIPPTSTVIYGTTETIVVPTTTTIIRSLSNGTIIEVIIQKTGTQGGGGFCHGSNVSSCVGFATLQMTYETSTSYVFPSMSGNFNATVKTTTSYGTITCVSPKTTTITVTQNSTYVDLVYTWTASCSG